MKRLIAALIIGTSVSAQAEESIDRLLKSIESRSKEATQAGASGRGPASYRPKPVKKADPKPVEAPKDVVPAPTAPAVPTKEPVSLEIPSNQTPEREEQKSLNFSAVYKGDVVSNMDGGLKKKTVYIGNLDLKLDVNLEKIAGAKGLRAFFYGIGDHGADRDGGPSTYVGNATGVDNIETTTDLFRLYEAYLEQSLFDDKVSILAGLHDLNSEFYVTESSGLFLNPSFGIGYEFAQTGENGPSIFPVTAPALRIRVAPSDDFYLQSAAFNGQAGDPNNEHGTTVRASGRDGQLFITEAGWRNGKSGEKGYTKLALGSWMYSKPADHQYETVTDSNGDTVAATAVNQGQYLLAEHVFGGGISAFLRYGTATGAVNMFEDCVGTGIQILGPFNGRPEDRFGIAWTRASLSNQYKTMQEQSGNSFNQSESVFETSYRFQLNENMAVQPDYQWVIHPSADPSIANAQVGAIRFEIGF